MGKKKKAAVTVAVAEEKKLPSLQPYSPLLIFRQFWVQALILVVIGFAFYGNSLQNKTALDDEPVITKNDFVKAGFGGIDSIFKYDSFYCFYRSLGVKDQLPGGRYRPLSIVTFAIEWELFGDDPFVRHLVNVILYILSIVVLLYFLSNYLLKHIRGGGDIAFLVALLFLIHPIHTEVVANTKSRDEILSFMFIILTLLFALKYSDTGKLKWGLVGGFVYLLALLSKEWGVTLVILIPACLYLFRKESLSRVLKSSIPFFAVALVFLLIRSGIVTNLDKEEKELLNNPYVLATNSERMGSKIYVLLKYFMLQCWPHPLSSDYNYNTLPYRSMSNPLVLTSLLLHLGAIVASIWLLVKRNFWAFPVLFYLGHLFLVSNFRFNVGATMGERLIYHSSFGFLLLFGFAVIIGLEKIKSIKLRQALYLLLPLLLLLPSYFIVTERNRNWYNDTALFTHDVKVVPNSAWMNGNAGRCYIVLADSSKEQPVKKLYLDTARVYLRKAVSIHPGFVNAWFYLGSSFHRIENIDSAEYCWNEARKYFPNHPEFKNQYDVILSQHYVKIAEDLVKEKKLPEAIPYLERALKYRKEDAEMWYNLGGIYYTLQNFQKAYEAWSECLKVKPDHKLAGEAISHLQVKK